MNVSAPADTPATVGAPADVLALVSSIDPWSPATHAAMTLAATFGSRVTGCYVDPSLRTFHGGETESSVLALLMDAPHEHPRDRDAFLALARKSGVERACWVATRAGIARTMQQLGAWHDLIVIERDLAMHEGSFDVLGEALLSCRTPCLILPPGWQGKASFNHLALAWSGSIESIRAIHAALPLARLAARVELIDGESPVYDDDQERAPHFEPHVYLASHGIDVHTRRIHATPHEAGEALLREVAQSRADLLIMGAYGHSRLRERVLGGATRHVLQHAVIPVLMQH